MQNIRVKRRSLTLQVISKGVCVCVLGKLENSYNPINSRFTHTSNLTCCSGFWILLSFLWLSNRGLQAQGTLDAANH